MVDANPIRTLGDYSKPSHEGYKNTIELPVGKNVVPFRFDAIWDFAKPVKEISLPQDFSSTSDCRLIELKNQVQRLMEAHLAPMQPTQVNKINSSCEICSGLHDNQYYMENPEQAFVEYTSSHIVEARGKEEAPYWTTLRKKESYKPQPSFYGIGAQTPYYARKDFLDCHLPGEWEIVKDAKINPFKDVLVFSRMDKPPKHEDRALHAKIRIIDPDGEEFTKSLQSIPTTRKLSEREIQGRSSTWTTSMTLDL
nr:hypothetical protein [Tanacetum cinerariifolium]